MRKTAIVVLMFASLSACGKKAPPSSVTDEMTADGTDDQSADELDLIELPAMQADLVAKAGSDTVFFDTDEYQLDASDRATLLAQAAWLQANPRVRASIEGHADERGTREYNQALGERRANAARNFLIAQGVSPDRLLVTSWGKERPVALGSNENAWAQNRRSVTVVVR